MRLPVDDEIYDVNSVWLGPPGRTLPFRARYAAYAVGALVFVILQALERQLGIGIGFFTIAYSVLATVGLTRGILALVDHDRPVTSALRTLANEIGAPRANSHVQRATFRPARVRAVPSRPSRAPRHGHPRGTA